MPWYCRVKAAINTAMPFLVPTQMTNLALLVSAILKKRTLCLSELARAYPTPEKRKVAAPKHELLHRIKRLWRFIDNERVEAMEVQLSLVPYTIARLGYPRWLGLAIDWTMFNTMTPSGEQTRYQVLRIAVPCRGRALPLLQLAYDRDRLPAKSQNRIEQDVLLAVVRALPEGVRPVVLADRGFARATFYVLAQEASARLRGAHRQGHLPHRSGRTVLEAGRGRALAGSVAPCAGCALRPLPWTPPRPRDQRGSVLEGSQEPGERPQAQSARRTVVPGNQPFHRQKCRLVVLAEGLDRTVLQGRQEPFRAQGGESRFS